jgi:hypothetical protein
MMTKHNKDISSKEIYKINNNNVQNTNDDIQNTNDDIQNTNDKIQNTNDDIQNTNDKIRNTNDDKCIKCNKILSCKSSLNRHLKICKGVTNVLECHFCHKILSHSSSKSQHLKICKSKIITINNTNNNTTNNNTTNNNINNTINGNITTNNITNNTIVFNLESSKKIEFESAHITLDVIKQLIKDSKTNTLLFLKNYFRKMLENNNNICVIKNSLKSNHSKIYNEDKKWVSELDRVLYPKLLNDIAEHCTDYLDEKEEELKIPSKRYYRMLEFLADLQCGDYHILTKEDKTQDYIDAIESFKLITYDYSNKLSRFFEENF